MRVAEPTVNTFPSLPKNVGRYLTRASWEILARDVSLEDTASEHPFRNPEPAVGPRCRLPIAGQRLRQPNRACDFSRAMCSVPLLRLIRACPRIATPVSPVVAPPQSVLRAAAASRLLRHGAPGSVRRTETGGFRVGPRLKYSMRTLERDDSSQLWLYSEPPYHAPCHLFEVPIVPSNLASGSDAR